MEDTLISLGNYYNQFVKTQVAAGRYQNESEVIRAGLRLLENEEIKIMELKNAIKDGIESGIANDFNPQRNLEELKAGHKSNDRL